MAGKITGGGDSRIQAQAMKGMNNGVLYVSRMASARCRWASA
jgi:hypothetical protein